MARIGWSIWRPIDEGTGEVHYTHTNPWLRKSILIMDPVLGQAAVAGEKQYIAYATAVAKTVNDDHYTDFEPRITQLESWAMWLSHPTARCKMPPMSCGAA